MGIGFLSLSTGRLKKQSYWLFTMGLDTKAGHQTWIRSRDVMAQQHRAMA